jgi:hypothetical protein
VFFVIFVVSGAAARRRSAESFVRERWDFMGIIADFFIRLKSCKQGPEQLNSSH